MREQVTRSQESLLALYISQMDKTLEQVRTNLLQNINTNLSLTALSIHAPGSLRHQLGLQDCKRWLENSIATNPILSAQFIYLKDTDTLLTASSTAHSRRHSYIRQHVDSFTGVSQSLTLPSWNHLLTAGFISENTPPSFVLVKGTWLSGSVYIGAVVEPCALLKPLESVLEYPGSITLMYNTQGVLLTNSNLSPALASDLSSHLDSLTPFWLRDTETGLHYLVLRQNMEMTPLCVVTLLPEAQILHFMDAFRQAAMLLPAALLTIGIAMVLLIRSMVHKPLTLLLAGMQTVSAGDLAVRLPAGNSTEFTVVNQRFNRMVEEIQKLNAAVHEQTERTHKAELRHLQAQINPHFYQNTLNLIYNLAALKEYALIQKTSLYLAEYFRFIMRSGDQLTSLGSELAHVTHYMELQKIRYPQSVEYTLDVDASVHNIQILPLLIQPFVENSIIHGYTTKRAFHITVRARQIRDRLCIEIVDNGRGMPTETMTGLAKLFEQGDDTQTQHIGVWNVVTRLRKHYGKHASLTVCPGCEYGVTVKLQFPLDEAKEARV